MSDFQNTTQPTVETSEPTTGATQLPETSLAGETSLPSEDATPMTNGVAHETQETAAVAPVDDVKAEESPAEKTIEPITEGQLGYKGPGILKSLVPSKKEFWLSDAPVTPQHMHLYTRGEKPEVSNPVVAWAAQTGRGLLFFNKKGETEQTRPHSVLPLYEASDLKKVSPHEVSFDIAGQKHTLKAASDVERDGWYVSLERAIEMGKAEKESIRGSEGYQAEMEKMNKPNTMAAGVGGASALRSKSQPKKSTDVDGPRRAGSEGDEEMDKKHKNRSASRGMLNKLKGKKEEREEKKEEKAAEKEAKKEEKTEAKEEKKEEKAEAKAEKKEEKAEAKAEKKEEKAEIKAEKREEKAEKKAEKKGEAVPLVGGATFDAPSTAERALGAPVEEPVTESSPVTDASVNKPEEKLERPNKRNSIFGRMGSSFSGLKSPGKERSQKDAELKPMVPPKDTGVSETAPQIPEPSTDISETPAAVPYAETSEQKSEGKPAEAAKEQLDGISPSNNQTFGGGFLSSLPFIGKRNRSVSPSANMKEAPAKKEEVPLNPIKDESAIEEPIQPVTETAAEHEPVGTPMERVEEPSQTEPTSPSANRRTSMFGNLSRRASKAFGRQTPVKKENVAPTSTEAREEALEADKPMVNGESMAPEVEQQQNSIGDVVPETVNAGHAHQSTPTVTASA